MHKVDHSLQPRRHGVVAVIQRDERLLVIRRSQFVSAPGKLCFPGGGIESGETEPQALARELEEELAVAIEPVRCLWNSVTRWNVALAWWLARLPKHATICPDPKEVDEVHWMRADELRSSPDLLESNHEFLDALMRGDIRFVQQRG